MDPALRMPLPLPVTTRRSRVGSASSAGSKSVDFDLERFISHEIALPFHPDSWLSSGSSAEHIAEEILQPSPAAELPRIDESGRPGTALGVAFVFGSTVFFSLASVVVKQDVMEDGTHFPTVEIGMLRGIVSVLFAVLGCKASGVPVIPKADNRTRMICVLRGLFDFLASNCFYVACSQLPIAAATVIMFTNPFWAGIMAKFILMEDYTRWDVLLTCLAFGGVLVTVWPDMEAILFGTSSAATDGKTSKQATGLCFACVASVFQAMQYIAGRMATKGGVHWLQANGAYGIATLFLGPPLAYAVFYVGASPRLFVLPSEWNTAVWSNTCGVVVASFLAQVLLIQGLSADIQAALVAVIRAMDIPMALIWAALLLGVFPQSYEVAGGMILAFACVSQTILKLNKARGHARRAREARAVTIAVRNSR